MQLYPRNIIPVIEKVLPREEWVVLTGARQIGKTSVMLYLKDQLEKSGSFCSYLNLENPEYLDALDSHPFNLFEFLPKQQVKQYVFLDEIQYLKDPSRFLKLLFDEKRSQVKLIVSGSSSFYIDKKFTDSLAGRKFLFELYPLDFAEYLSFRGEPELLVQAQKHGTAYYLEKLDDYWDAYSRFGGYPRVALAGGEEDLVKVLLEEIITSYVRKDITDAGVRNTGKYYALLKILAQQTGNLVNATELANTLDLNIQTVDDYLYSMQKSYHICLIRPFYRNYRKEFTKMPKVYFFDQGLRGFLADELISKPRDTRQGDWLENLFFSEMAKQEGGAEKIKFWRTQDKKEVDFVVGRRAYEIKTQSGKSDKRKYKQFQELYPEIGLNFISRDNLRHEVYGG